MKRQSIRSALILISFLLLPVTLFYFSPVLIIMAATQGIIAGSAIAFLLQFLGAIFFGRLFCGWMCGAGGLQRACFSVNDRHIGKRARWVKYAIWVPWVCGIGVASWYGMGAVSVDVFYQTRYGISVSHPAAYIVYFTVTGIILILALVFGRRAFCHYGCWMAPFMVLGEALGRRLRVPALRLSADKDKCTDCKLCRKVCPMSLDVPDMVKQGRLRDIDCILCGSCVDKCPKAVIHYTFGR